MFSRIKELLKRLNRGTSVKSNARMLRLDKTKEELKQLKSMIAEIQGKHVSRLDRLEGLHGKSDEVLDRHWEWIQHHKRQIHDQRDQGLEIKAELQEIKEEREQIRAALKSVEKVGEALSRIHELERRIGDLAVIGELGVEQPKQATVPQVRALTKTAPTAVELVKNLRPNERRIFGILFSEFTKAEDGWISFSDILKHAYPTHDDKKLSTSLLAKAMKPLYDTALVEKQKRKNSAFVRPTRFGLDAAKEVGMIEQKKKIDSLYSKLK